MLARVNQYALCRRGTHSVPRRPSCTQHRPHSRACVRLTPGPRCEAERAGPSICDVYGGASASQRARRGLAWHVASTTRSTSTTRTYTGPPSLAVDSNWKTLRVDSAFFIENSLPEVQRIQQFRRAHRSCWIISYKVLLERGTRQLSRHSLYYGRASAESQRARQCEDPSISFPS